MKVLIVCSRRKYAYYTDYVAPFIYEQVNIVRQYGVNCDYFLVQGGQGFGAYFKALFKIRKEIKHQHFDLIHANGGLCGFICSINRRIPTITTYHGSDVNSPKTRMFSRLAMLFSKFNIFVSNDLLEVATQSHIVNKFIRHKSIVIPCGIDVYKFHNLDRLYAKNQLNWDANIDYVLFSKEFADKVKNYPLAKAAIDILNQRRFDSLDHPVTLVELYGYTREQMPLLYNAAVAGVLTSFSEGSPQFIKEAVACGCPIVSTKVGDVENIIDNVTNCELCDYNAIDVANKLEHVIKIGHTTQPKLKGQYTIQVTANKVIEIYNMVCKKK